MPRQRGHLPVHQALSHCSRRYPADTNLPGHLARIRAELDDMHARHAGSNAAADSKYSAICSPPRTRHATIMLTSSSQQNYAPDASRSEEHTSELQSRSDLVCRLLLEKK